MKRQMIRLFHTTISPNTPTAIMRDGFRDCPTRIVHLSTTYWPPRVWFSDIPLIDHHLFDGPLWANVDNTVEQQNFIAVDVRLPVHGIESSANVQDATVNADGTISGILPSHVNSWPCTQYWGPAEIWNKFPRTRLTLDDAIRLRIAADPKRLRKIIKWLGSDDRLADARYRASGITYFEDRIEKILAEMMARGKKRPAKASRARKMTDAALET